MGHHQLTKIVINKKKCPEFLNIKVAYQIGVFSMFCVECGAISMGH